MMLLSEELNIFTQENTTDPLFWRKAKPKRRALVLQRIKEGCKDPAMYH